MSKFIYSLFFLFYSALSHAQLETPLGQYKIYLDADFISTKAASTSILQGINSALNEVNYRIAGYEFKVELKNHQGNSLRSKHNLEQFLADKRALVVFSGLHSPPILANQQFINNNQILLLTPWAAAAPITRTTDSENWIFRLSIDDSKAGFTITEHAVKQGFIDPYLLLEDTGWGQSNKKTMTTALDKADLTARGITWFNWGLGKNRASIILRNIADSDADVIFFVGNASEGKILAQAMSELPAQYRLPIRSHWGITGGDFAKVITPDIRKKLDIEFIQTSFSFLSPTLTAFQSDVLKDAIHHFPDINSAYDIKAQSGFIHAYDLTRLLIAAIEQSQLTGNAIIDRKTIKAALENLQKPVMGLIKTYQSPYSKYTVKTPDVHEALDSSDYTMGFYGSKNEVILMK